MSDQGGIGWVQVVGWTVAIGGSCASLLWNWFNRRHTDKLARRIRVENFRADQWAEARGAIQSALSDFSQAVEAILVLAPIPGGAPLAQQLLPLNLQLAVKHGALGDALQAAEENTLYVENRNWVSLGYGPPNEIGETPWDRMNTALAAASASKTDAKLRAALAPLRAELVAIKQSVGKGVRVENVSHDPEKY